MRHRRACVGGLVVALVSVGPLIASAASGHDLWLEPPPPSAPGDLVTVEARIGHTGHAGEARGEAVRRDAARIVRLEAHGPATGPSALPGIDGQAPLGVLRPAEPGPWVLAYETRPFRHTLPAARFAAYLEEEGLDRVAHARRVEGTLETPGRELVSRAVKMLLAVGDSAPADRRIGLPVELIAEQMPAPGEGGTLALRVEVGGAPRSGVLVDLDALDRPSGPVRAERTGADGRVRFSIEPGRWLATAVHARPFDGATGRAGDAESPAWRTVFAAWTVDLRAPGS
ncbi:MAG: DUF4198 domain-containing protein [Acidobacteriota bacterium]